MSTVTLKKGKEKIFEQRHHWIFSGAIDSIPENYQDGALISITSSMGNVLGYGYFNRKSALTGRIISYGAKDPYPSILECLEKALALRAFFFNEEITNAYRLLNSEGDGIPGLIIDRYGPYFVIQSGTLGMDMLKPFIVKELLRRVSCLGIYEKSCAQSRKEEGLAYNEGVLFGEIPDEIEIVEEGHRFQVSLRHGQKTGFFLDQREMRSWVKEHAQAKRVLNCFSYSGGFSIYALKNGACRVDSVDISEDAYRLYHTCIQRNGLENTSHQFFTEDVFTFLRERELNYDLVILDPPAFAKKKKDIIAACRGYKEINRLAFQKMPSKSILLTCSCSYHVDATLFQQVVFQAAQEAGREVKIIGKQRLGVDHPINLYHPEADYLKSLILYIDN